MPKRPDAENILAKFRPVSLDKEIEHTSFTLNQLENGPHGEKRFEIHYTAVVTLSADDALDAPEDETASAASHITTALSYSGLSNPDFLRKL